MVVPWFFQNFLGIDGWGLDRWFLLSDNDFSFIFQWLITSRKWCSILLIERYLAAEFGTRLAVFSDMHLRYGWMIHVWRGAAFLGISRNLLFS